MSNENLPIFYAICVKKTKYLNGKCIIKMYDIEQEACANLIKTKKEYGRDDLEVKTIKLHAIEFID